MNLVIIVTMNYKYSSFIIVIMCINMCMLNHTVLRDDLDQGYKSWCHF